MTTREVGRIFSIVPTSGRKCSGAGKSSGWRAACTVFLLCAATAIAAPAQTFQTLINFNGYDGDNPDGMAFVQGEDGNLYGTAGYGGADCNAGTVFRITPTGGLTTLYIFCPAIKTTDGYYPRGSLVLGRDGYFYGTTFESDLTSTNHPGTFFKITPGGTLTTLHDFNPADGRQPGGALVQANDGNFYGTSAFGGVNDDGTVYKITPGGELTTLYDFDLFPQGAIPVAGLIQATDGNFYGTTYWGGDYDGGTVFKITSAGGKIDTLYSFCSPLNCDDGNHTWATLVQGADGNFYGTTVAGGSGNCPVSGGCGTVFKITPAGQLTTLYSFCTETNCSDGGLPLAGLIQATDGNFYGTTNVGGANGNGTIFQIIPGITPTLTTLHSFDGTDGLNPAGALFQATNGTLYGTTYAGGTYGAGTVFSLSVGLRPFVTFVHDKGKVGSTAQILGQGLLGTTSVSFNGTPATTFSAKADTFLTATVPTGATNGPVTVTTHGRTLRSNVRFLVVP